MTLTPSFSAGARAALMGRPSLTSTQLTLGLALFFVLFDNHAFWRTVFSVFPPSGGENLGFALTLFLLLMTVLSGGLALIGFRGLFKPLAVLLVMAAAAAGYFMEAYGIVIDRTMVQNVMETDVAEAAELFDPSLALHLLLFGLLPSLLILRAEIRYRPLVRELLAKLVLVAVCVAVLLGPALAYYKEFASLSRNNRALGHMINPVATVGAVAQYIGAVLKSGDAATVEPLGLDAHVASDWHQRGHKNVMVLVVGESARAQNFTLNGYGRETTPRLAHEAVINFSHVSSCGTTTAVSLPCMFALQGRDDYSDADARRSEGLLDVLRHAGVEVLWRDNNSGCKGACRGVETEDMAHLALPGLCRGDHECFDEVMLQGLGERLDALHGDAVIVLHQKGSHGPTYHQRYPASAARFTPACNTNQLQDCSREEVVNAYDNTIYYTDRLLGGVIDLLKGRQGEFNTAMIYLSDHGESLGENNLYLHGLPYLIAPDTQTRVPWVMWLSDGFKRDSGLSTACLRARAGAEYSHDNLFHTLLGVMGVETAVYDPALDVTAPCRDIHHAVRGATPGRTS